MSVATITQTDPKADAIGRRAFLTRAQGLPPSARQRQQQCLCTNSAHASGSFRIGFAPQARRACTRRHAPGHPDLDLAQPYPVGREADWSSGAARPGCESAEPRSKPLISNARNQVSGDGFWNDRIFNIWLTHMDGTVVHRKLRFGPFELSIGERVLRRDGRVLPLGNRALDILTYLADRPGEVLAKQELMDHVWSEVTVEEGSLRVHVAAIRKALGDGQFGNRYIANIKGRGYSFVGTVVRLEDGKGGGSNSPNFQGRLAAQPLVLIGRRRRCPRFVTGFDRDGSSCWVQGHRQDNGRRAGHDADVRLIAALVHALKAGR
jgi:DNA-binding winged helix-turn-helix (wHTH) protein